MVFTDALLYCYRMRLLSFSSCGGYGGCVEETGGGGGGRAQVIRTANDDVLVLL